MRNEVIKKLSNVKDLPSFPEVAHEVLQMVERDDFTVKDLQISIERDPGLATKVLKVANSFAFNPYGREITSLDRAIIQLGVKNLVPIVVGLSVVKISDRVGGRFDKELFWKHSYTCAHVAKRLSKYFGLPEGEAFTAGLLHDVGKLVLYMFFPEEYEEALELSEKENLLSYEAEQKVFGIDHSEVGEFISRLWKLPLLITETVRFHHEPEKAEHYRKMVALIHVSDIFSRTFGFYYNRDLQGISIEEDQGWIILTEGKQSVEDMLLPVLDDVEEAVNFANVAWGKE